MTLKKGRLKGLNKMKLGDDFVVLVLRCVYVFFLLFTLYKYIS